VQYSYDDGSIWVVNNGFHAHKDLSVRARVYMLDGTLAAEDTAELDVNSDTSARALTLPEPGDASDTYFVALELSEQGKVVSDNLYWLSTRAEVIDWEDSDFRHTGTAQFADFTALSRLPDAQLELSSSVDGELGLVRVTLTNPGSALAFFVRLTLTAGADGKPVWPVLWSDNYVTVLPGQTRELSVRYEPALLAGAAPVVQVQGLNVAGGRTGD
jgi:exo-1,4-beta-D-glucosaminidase